MVLAVRLLDRHPSVPHILTAKVRHSTAQADGTWLVGCRLSRLLAEKELRALL